MKENISPEDFAGKSLFIATPAYGGKVDVPYMMSIVQTAILLERWGVRHDIYMLTGESIVTRARNNCVAEFMARGDYTHMIFIDADGEFDPMDVLKFLYSDEDVLAAAVPKKGLPIEYNVSIVRDESGKVIIHKNKFAEVEYIGAAFLMIKKEVILKMFDHYKDLKYSPFAKGEIPIDQEVRKKNELVWPDSCIDFYYALFDTEVNDERRIINGAGQRGPMRYHGEDYMFCARWRKIGGKILLDPSVKINHIGQYTFKGDLSKLGEATL